MGEYRWWRTYRNTLIFGRVIICIRRIFICSQCISWPRGNRTVSMCKISCGAPQNHVNSQFGIMRCCFVSTIGKKCYCHIANTHCATILVVRFAGCIGMDCGGIVEVENMRGKSSKWNTWDNTETWVELCEIQWKPSWFLSRGCSLNELKNNYLWWNGPAWLCNYSNIKINEFSNNIKQNISADVFSEKKIQSMTVTTITGTHELYIFSLFSSWKKSVHVVVAYILGFVNNALCKMKNTKKIKRIIFERNGNSIGNYDINKNGATMPTIRICERNMHFR